MDILLPYSPEQLAHQGSAPHGGDGVVLIKAGLQLHHYTVGRVGRRAAKETSSTAFKYCSSKIHCFVPSEEEPDTWQGSSLLVNTCLSTQGSCSTAAKAIEEQKNDETPEKLPQAKGPLWVSLGAAKDQDLITWLMAHACD